MSEAEDIRGSVRPDEHIRREVADGYHVLRMDRPEKKNALNRAMYRALTHWLVAGEADDAIAAHAILGSPGIFCAGNDLADFLAADAEQTGDGPERFDDVLDFIRLLPRLRKPLVAGVDGLAVGIGTTLLFHCDVVLATSQAAFSTPFVDLGLVQEAGAGLLAPRLLGHPRAFALLVAGKAFEANELMQAGLISAVIPTDALESAVRDAARRLAEKPREAMLKARALLRPDVETVTAQVEREIEAFRERLSSPEAQQALSAFLAGKTDRSGEAC